MPACIDNTCPSPKLNIMYSEIVARVGLGPVILGENHSKPEARAVVRDLISAGLVKRLFLELYDLKLGEPRSAGKALRTDHLGLPEDQWQKTSALQVTQSLANHCEERFHNPLLLTQVMNLAVSSGVKVYLYDIATQAPTSNENMQARHDAMSQTFLSHTVAKYPLDSPPKAIGAVALIGGSHLSAPVNDTHYKLTLQQACGVPPASVFDLSNL